MDVHPITYEMLSAVIAALMVVGGAWFFIDKKIDDTAREAKKTIEMIEAECALQYRAAIAEIALVRETLYTKYVSNDSLIRLEERILGEIRELRRYFNKQGDRE